MLALPTSEYLPDPFQQAKLIVHKSSLISVNGRSLPDEINLIGRDEFGALDNLPAKEEDYADEDHAVVDEKVADGEVAGQVNGITVTADNCGHADQAVPCAERLEPTLVW